jgi:hypothetical protein
MTPLRPTAWHSPVCPRGLRQVSSPGGSRRTESHVRSMTLRWVRFGPTASLWADVAHNGVSGRKRRSTQVDRSSLKRFLLPRRSRSAVRTVLLRSAYRQHPFVRRRCKKPRREFVRESLKAIVLSLGGFSDRQPKRSLLA